MSSDFGKLARYLTDFRSGNVEKGEFYEDGVKMLISEDAGGYAVLSIREHNQELRAALTSKIVARFTHSPDERTEDGIVHITFALWRNGSGR